MYMFLETLLAHTFRYLSSWESVLDCIKYCDVNDLMLNVNLLLYCVGIFHLDG